MSRAGRTGGGRGRLGHVLSSVATATGCVLFLGGFVWAAVLYRPYTVPTGSMAPTVDAGDRVLAQRIDGDQVRRGDIVVFRDSVWGGLPVTKRVVGVGGDTVECCDDRGRLTVNGTPVDEPYVRGQDRASLTAFETTVPEGRLFLLGDHRSESLDSRTHLQDANSGSVDRDAVTGRVDATVWPLSGAGMVDRPGSFADLPGGISRPGPLGPLLAAIAAGAALILGGAAYDPLAALRERRRSLAHNGGTHA
ncbi:signal peptidase I [Streptomyces sp. TRM 70361]|uniref:signal peptidase I n=1 Tax=Streptomyces sp. TRM 70361 TaxID=3116553 RepID=UPI002E7B6B0E|nr:signal peptidase I [Streptomyces sp. TRM 70361]MEE1941845.1 signal peptidase I [Streptomyces sp. TRM 70361]